MEDDARWREWPLRAVNSQADTKTPNIGQKASTGA